MTDDLRFKDSNEAKKRAIEELKKLYDAHLD
jgi:hypothetical protein